MSFINPLSANFTKWSNTLKQFACKLPTNCLSVFDHFVGLALKGLKPFPQCSNRKKTYVKNFSSYFSISRNDIKAYFFQILQNSMTWLLNPDFFSLGLGMTWSTNIIPENCVIFWPIIFAKKFLSRNKNNKTETCMSTTLIRLSCQDFFARKSSNRHSFIMSLLH